MIQVRRYSAPLPGPTLLVFGAIHGNEVCGPRALERIQQELDSRKLKLERGHFIFVPIANPEAYARGVRLFEKNLNRVFEPRVGELSYEERLANELCPLMQQCDYFLDLHSMTAKGEPFVFLNRDEARSRDFCLSLGVKKVMKGWAELYARSSVDDSCCTQTYADRLAKPNALVECGTHGAPEADELAYQCVLRALTFLNMLSRKVDLAPQDKAEFLTLSYVYFRKSPMDRLVKEWKTFDVVGPGELIALLGPEQKEFRAEKAAYIVFPNPETPLNTELFYLADRSQ